MIVSPGLNDGCKLLMQMAMPFVALGAPGPWEFKLGPDMLLAATTKKSVDTVARAMETAEELVTVQEMIESKML